MNLRANNIQPTIQHWLNTQCVMISGALRGIAVLVETDVESDTASAHLQACWPEPIQNTNAIKAAAIKVAAADKQVLQQGKTTPAGHTVDRIFFPCPLAGDHPARLVIIIELPASSKEELYSVINVLRWSSEWLAFALRQSSALDAQGLGAIFQMTISCLDQSSFQSMAMSLVTGLATLFSCQRVSLGLLKGKHTEIQVLSHTARFKHESSLIREIGVAMDEAIDQDRIIIYPNNSDKSDNKTTSITFAHAELAKHLDTPRITTLPLSYRGEVIGALTLERNSDIDFTDAVIHQLEQLLALITPVLMLKHQDERSLPAKLWHNLKTTSRKLFGPEHIRLKAFTLSSLILVLFFSFAEGNWRITADAVVEGSVQRTIAAPIDGYIATATRRAGDVVQQNEELGRLDDEDLQLERLKWSTQRQQTVREYREALAQHNRAEVSIIGAKIKQADAQIKLLDEQLTRTRLLSPFAGIIIEGDLSQSLGTPVTRGDTLFKIAPLDDYRIILKVDEKDIAPISEGQTGKLILTSLTDQKLDLEISKITQVSTPEDGRNFFRVEARLANSEVTLRPGMEGVGKIEVGERKLIWIWTRNLGNWLRLQLWTWWQ